MSEMEQLVELLLRRRARVPELVTTFRESSRQPFPKWMRGEAERVKRLFVEPKWAM